jgi:hypothetical protein
MSQITIKLSDKADALIAQLQKEIFNRRRKKVSAAGVIETLVESGAKSQSDKRFATSWTNLVADIEKAAKVADAHGSKPANLTDAEWAIVLSHRTRSGGLAKPSARKAPLAKAKTKLTPSKVAKPAVAAKAPAAKSTRAKAAAAKTAKVTSTKTSVVKAAATKSATAKSAVKKPAVRKATATKATASKATAAKATASKPALSKTTTRKTATAKPGVAKTAPAKTVSKPEAAPKSTAKTTPRKATRSSVAQRMAKAVTRLGSTGAAPSPNGATAAKITATPAE